MGVVVNTHEAKTRLSELIRLAEQGEDVVVARGGHPIVRLVPIADRPVRSPGAAAGRIWVADDAFSSEVDDEISALFEGDD